MCLTSAGLIYEAYTPLLLDLSYSTMDISMNSMVCSVHISMNSLKGRS